jgi:hypothetical protein
MRLVQTLVVRDEVDIVDAQIAHHLNAGVDFVIASDHESVDGTTEILESYARAGHLRLIRVSGEVRETQWRTEMARLAATDHGADWVINTDADEFWMPRSGSLKDVFTAVPESFGVVWALSRHFVPRPNEGRAFAEAMTARFSSQAALNDPTSPYRPHAKAAHRADDRIEVRFGSHRVVTSLEPLPNWYPADVLHFPFRSLEQYERKTVRRAHGDKGLAQYVKGFQARERGRIRDVYATLLVDDEQLERGLADGSLVRDTRLRDALRLLSVEANFGAEPLETTYPPPGRADVSDALADAAAFRDAELVRLVRNVDDMRVRVEAIGRRRRGRLPDDLTSVALGSAP